MIGVLKTLRSERISILYIITQFSLTVNIYSTIISACFFAVFGAWETPFFSIISVFYSLPEVVDKCSTIRRRNLADCD